jgi:Mannosyltransferase putative
VDQKSGSLDPYCYRPESLTPESALDASEAFLAAIPPFPRIFDGRGIVICAGGPKYFHLAWTSVRMLRHLGCTLPIEMWHLGPQEVDASMGALLAPLGVTTVDAYEIRKLHPTRILKGWELKPYSILHSRFQEVLYIDADNYAVANPEFLFETTEYKSTGAIFWPDQQRLKADRDIWRLCGVDYRDEPEFESGQIVVDKARAWRPLSLCLWYNEYSDFYFRHVHGDKDLFHMAFRKTGHDYAMPARGLERVGGVFCQHDFVGRRLWQHRFLAKWSFKGPDTTVDGLMFECENLGFLDELRARWDGRIGAAP